VCILLYPHDFIAAGVSDLNGEIKDAYSFVGPVIDPQQFGVWLIQEV